ncbi:MAG: hypothetical protein WCI23_05040 [Chlorobiaceae bacterium]
MKTEEVDKAFDDGSDITPYLDLNKACRIKQQHKRVNVDFPFQITDDNRCISPRLSQKQGEQL